MALSPADMSTASLDDLADIDVLQAIDRDGLLGPSRASGAAAVLLMDEDRYGDDDWRGVFAQLNPPHIETRLLRSFGLD